MIMFILFLIGAAMAVVPWFFGERFNGTQQIALTVAGSFVAIISAMIVLYSRLYRRTSANMAFVRTGSGGAKPILDGGAIVIPVLHEVIPVSLETMRLNVERRGQHALITKDNLRVDLSAEFYIKVQANADDIIQAARSLGSRNVEANAVSELVQEKLVSALRTVAATKELVELHSARDEFASAVQQIVARDRRVQAGPGRVDQPPRHREDEADRDGRGRDAALKFELEKLRIAADKEVRIAAAQALGNMLSKANMQIFGDPTTMAKMSEQFMRAASLGTAADGLMRTLPPQAQDLLERVAASVGMAMKPATDVDVQVVPSNGHGGKPAASPVASTVIDPNASRVE